MGAVDSRTNTQISTVLERQIAIITGFLALLLTITNLGFSDNSRESNASSVSFNLVGTAVQPTQINSTAILEDSRSGKQDVYSIGDQLPGGFKLIRIETSGVLIRGSGKVAFLPLNGGTMLITNQSSAESFYAALQDSDHVVRASEVSEMIRKQVALDQADDQDLISVSSSQGTSIKRKVCRCWDDGAIAFNASFHKSQECQAYIGLNLHGKEVQRCESRLVSTSAKVHLQTGG